MPLPDSCTKLQNAIDQFAEVFDKLLLDYSQLKTLNKELLDACKFALPELKNKSSRYHPAILAIEKVIVKAGKINE